VERAARLMLDEHIHRVVVIDDEGVPVGVLTTSDLLHILLRDEEPAIDMLG
jgi:CBS domain-containing protein